MRDNISSREDRGEEDMGSDNGRMQRLERDGSKLEERVDALEDTVRDIHSMVARIEGFVADQKAAPVFWSKVSGVAAVVASLAAAASLVIGVVQANRMRSSVQGQVASIQGQVTRLQSDLRMLTGVLRPELLNQLGPVITSAIQLQDRDVGAVLQQPINVLGVLRQNKVRLSMADIEPSSEATRNMIQAHPTVPEVWNIAAQLVSYRSELQAQFGAVDLPNCLSLRDPRMDHDHITVGNQQYDIPGFSSVKFPHWQTHASETNCILDLDDDGSFSQTAVGQYFEEVRRLHPGLDVVSIVLDHAVIRYSGGKLIPITEIQFKNCLFDFRAPKTAPPIPGRKLTDQLLLADLNSGSAQIPAGM
jgi:hypothetical protein